MLATHLAVIKNGKVEFLEPLEIPEGTQVLVTLLSGEQKREITANWTHLACQGLERAYDEAEPEYSLNSLQERNPDYEGR